MPLTPLTPGVFYNGVLTGAIPAGIAGYVVNVNWSALQTTQGGAIAGNNLIDQAIARNNGPFHVRVFCGKYAPVWVRTALGTVTIQDSPQGVGPTPCPVWWNTGGNFLTYHLDLVTKLATKYDGLIESIQISGAETIFSEPLIRNMEDPVTLANLIAAGFTAAQDITTIQGVITNWANQFHTTRLVMWFHPYDHLTDPASSTWSRDVNQALSFMDYLRAATADPTQAVLGNNSIRNPTLSGNYTTLYNGIVQRGKPIMFQTAGANNIGNLDLTLQWAASEGAYSVETFTTYATAITQAQLINDAHLLAANLNPPPALYLSDYVVAGSPYLPITLGWQVVQFTPNDLVTLTLDAVTVATGTTDPTGQFTGTFTVPNGTTIGVHQMKAQAA